MKSSLYDTPSKYIWNIIKIMKAQVDGSIISSLWHVYLYHHHDHLCLWNQDWWAYCKSHGILIPTLLISLECIPKGLYPLISFNMVVMLILVFCHTKSLKSSDITWRKTKKCSGLAIRNQDTNKALIPIDIGYKA